MNDTTNVIDPPELLDAKATAALLTCSVRTVWRLADGGRMPPPVRIGRLVRWRRKALLDWVSDGCPNVRVIRVRT